MRFSGIDFFHNKNNPYNKIMFTQTIKNWFKNLFHKQQSNHICDNIKVRVRKPYRAPGSNPVNYNPITKHQNIRIRSGGYSGYRYMDDGFWYDDFGVLIDDLYLINELNSLYMNDAFLNDPNNYIDNQQNYIDSTQNQYNCNDATQNNNDIGTGCIAPDNTDYSPTIQSDTSSSDYSSSDYSSSDSGGSSDSSSSSDF